MEKEHSNRIRPTSEQAYREIKEEGLLSRTRFIVYEYLKFNGPATGQEVNADLSGTMGGAKGYHKRLSELRDLGVVEEYETRKCRVTNRRAIAWRVTNNLPKHVRNRRAKPSDQSLRAALRDMRKCWLEHERTGTALSIGLIETMQWIAGMVTPPCIVCDGTGTITHLDGSTDSCPACKGNNNK